MWAKEIAKIMDWTVWKNYESDPSKPAKWLREVTFHGAVFAKTNEQVDRTCTAYYRAMNFAKNRAAIGARSTSIPALARAAYYRVLPARYCLCGRRRCL